MHTMRQDFGGTLEIDRENQKNRLFVLNQSSSRPFHDAACLIGQTFQGDPIRAKEKLKSTIYLQPIA